jgi:hypothetical protein
MSLWNYFFLLKSWAKFAHITELDIMIGPGYSYCYAAAYNPIQGSKKSANVPV